MKLDNNDLTNLTFTNLVENIFVYEKNQHLLRKEILEETVNRINQSYKVIGLVGIGKEGALIKIQDLTKSELVLKIASPIFNQPGKKKQRLYGIWKSVTEDKNQYKQRFINGCTVQQELSAIIKQHNPGFITVPNSVECYTHPGLYVKMEYIHGIDVLRYIREGKKLEESFSVYLLILHAVNFIHDFGFIHRDLKSENLFITGDETHKKIAILDWTMAKKCGMDSYTLPGMMMGTIPYASNKLVVDGESRNANYSDDVFSLGIMLWEFVNFKPAPKPQNPSILAKDKKARKEYLEHLRKMIPEFLIPIFNKATEEDEEKRYQTLDPFIHELGIALKREGILKKDLEWVYDEKGKEYSEMEQKIKILENMLRRQDFLIEKLSKQIDKIINAGINAKNRLN